MKTPLLSLALAALSFQHATAAVSIGRAALPIPTNTPPQLGDYDQSTPIGRHHQIHPVQRVDPETKEIVQSSYTELASGLNYLDVNGQWQRTLESFEIIDGHAVAMRGPHQAIIAPNAKTPGLVELSTPDGKRLRAHVLGLSLYNPTTGASELIAEVKDCVGELVPPNQVIYRDAFDSIKASIRYTYTKAGLEQDVILFESPFLPEGFDQPGCRLEVLTEFIDFPEVRKITNVLRAEKDEAKRAAMVEPDLIDEHLELGEMRIGHGRAFALGEPVARVAVAKRLETMPEGRTVLFEAVELDAVQGELDKLPRAQAFWMPSPSTPTPAKVLRAALPAAPLPSSSGGEERLMASLAGPDVSGFLIDWAALTSATDFTFKGDFTYYVSSDVTLSGSTILEGGSIIKFDRYNDATSYYPKLIVTGTLTCKTSAHLPAVFTARDDNTVGEVAPGSTGTPTGWYYGYYQLWCQGSYAYDIQNVRFRYGHVALYFTTNPGSDHTVRHAQFYKNFAALYVENGTLKAQNVLCLDNDNVLRVRYGATIKGEHLTVNKANFCPYYPNGTAGNTVILTNSLLVEIVNTAAYSGSNNQTASSGSSVFQTVGAGANYLATSSPHRNAGTTNINASLLADLKTRTTYSPVVLASGTTLTTPTDWFPITPRDTDTPDLGYHYDPIDYAIQWLYVDTGQKLVVNPGTVVAVYGPTGFRPKNNATLELNGVADRRIVVTGFENVQEQPGIWTSASSLIASYWGSTGVTMKLRFVDVPILASVQVGFYSTGVASLDRVASLDIRDCRFFNGQNWFGSDSTAVHSVVNNLFQRGQAYFADKAALSLYNNVFWQTSFSWNQDAASQPWTVRDNVFDQCWFSINTFNATLNQGYNAYANMTHRLKSQQQASDVIFSTAIAWQGGPLGNFYQPSSLSPTLVNVGSRAASAAGLYHHTTQTNQTKEAATTVDIGLHYVATGWTNGVSTTVEIPKAQMTVTSSSQDTANGWVAANVIDGNENNPGWISTSTSGPQWVRVALGGQYKVNRVAYRCRDEAQNGYGNFLQYEIYVTSSSSSNIEDWGPPVAGGTWSWGATPETKAVDLAVPKTGTAVIFNRVVGIPANSGGPNYASANEVWVYQESVTNPGGVVSNVPADGESDLTVGEKGRWRFDEGAGSTSWDLSGYGNHAIFAGGGSPVWTNGYRGTAVQFNGTSSYFTTQTGSNVFAVSALSIGAWIYPEGLPPATDARIAGKGTSKYGLTYGTDGKVYFYINNPANFISATVPTNQWSHVVGTASGYTLNLYVNGALVQTATGTAWSPGDTSTTIFSIGGPTSFFKGRIDDVIFETRALSLSEIQALYAPVGDGIADYLEDTNGNGVIDPGETDPNSGIDPGLQTRIVRPTSPLP